MGEGSTIVKDLPSFEEDEIIIEPEKVLKTRVFLEMDSRFSKGWSTGLNCQLRMPLGKISFFIPAQFPFFHSSWGQEDSREGVVTYYRRNKK